MCCHYFFYDIITIVGGNVNDKIKNSFMESFFSVMPIALIVTILSFFIDIPNNVIFSFSISSVILIIGISLFTTGIDMSMLPYGEKMGKSLVKKGNKYLILIMSFIFGTVITVAEPDLLVLASELTSIPDLLIIIFVAIGIGLFLLISVFRILKQIPYKYVITFSLILIMILLYFVPSNFISIAFDSGSVTTGPIGVPLIVAFGYGIARIRSDKNASGDSFGLCGLSSLGPIVMVLILGMFFKTDSFFDTSSFISTYSNFERFIVAFLTSLKKVCLSIIPILSVFGIFQIVNRNIKKKDLKKIGIGVLLSIIGLSLFLCGVSAGFLEMGYRIGNTIASSNDFKYVLIPLGMLLGYVIVTAEPAIKILVDQVCDLTQGSISKRMINLCLSVGVSIAIGLSIIRVFFNIPIIYIIVPGYFIAGLLMYFTPNIFSTIAFDSGGAASGALTTSFLLPVCIGACEALGGDILLNAFGVCAMVSLVPIITIQLLGIVYDYQNRSKEKAVYDETIIEY